MGSISQPLVDAIWDRDVDRLKRLLERGADPNSRVEGKPAVVWAAESDLSEAVRALLAHGADINAADDEGCSALMSAAFDGNVDVSKTLIDAGADVNRSDKDGCTALMNAAKSGSLDVLAALISSGAELNRTDSSGQTALIWAAMRGDFPKVIEMLASHGAEVDFQGGPFGWTALMSATYMRHLETMRTLLRLGADKGCVSIDPKHETALSIAHDGADPEVLSLLK